jgi:hypothetical protein
MKKGQIMSAEQKRKIGLANSHPSKETRMKLRKANLGKKLTAETKLKISKSKAKKTLGDKNPNWKGKDVSYGGLHAWLRRNLGTAKRCSRNKSHKAKVYNWANISGEYKRDATDWRELCGSCNKTDGIRIHKRFKIVRY